MPDFSPEGVRQFWQERHDHALYRIIASMESVESWSLDNNPQFEAAIQEFASFFDGIDKFELSQEENFVKVLSALKSARALRVLQYIDTLQPGGASKLLIYAEVASSSPEDLASFFLKRNLVFERLQLLGRIFAPERFALVSKAMESDDA
jgi:intracellular multiplication protein IcmW